MNSAQIDKESVDEAKNNFWTFQKFYFEHARAFKQNQIGSTLAQSDRL